MIAKVLRYGMIPLLFLSCSKNNISNAESSLSFKAVMPITEMKSTSTEEDPKQKCDTIMLFTGKNIVWYNDKTGELKFNDGFSIPEMYYNCINMLVFSEDELLFSIRFNVSGTNMSNFIIPPCFYIDLDVEMNREESFVRYFIIKSNPTVEGSEENWKANEPGWNLFIEQLKKEGKYRK